MPLYYHSLKRKRVYSRMSPEERAERFWSFVQKTDDCWLWNGAQGGRGYGYYGKLKAHRYSWELTNGPIPDGLLVCHHCDNRTCVRPDHMFLGTNTDNIKDASRKGRLQEVEIPATQNSPYFSGERNGRAKVTEEQVREIRRRYSEESISQHELAAQAGISRGTINHIVTRRTWQHVK